MPPRIPSVARLNVTSLCFRPAPSNGPSTVAAVANASSLSQAQKKRHRDPYAIAQAKQRKAANIQRQAQLKQEREQALGDPVKGIETPFLKSFDTAGTVDATSADGTPIKSAQDSLLNHFLTATELEKSIQHSYELSKPVISEIRDTADPAIEKALAIAHAEGHERAVTALARITSLANASRKDKTRVNVRRCIETFGRHQTDAVLKPKAPIAKILDGQPEKTPRAGPDTGSSEVQIAILTAKIRVLAHQLEQKGEQKDKMNKRNLRLLVHRRQKHLRYLRTKERGSERWQHLVSTLGLSDGTWKGEISL
ncbi:hypothetical protein BP6252_10571 [Coleophoma cylindrospora]|uniref:Ribosomal protein S15 n=1 Tax=Coleophoma cylindrospora TaxID=1849047 RepID=A0A3D8QTC9_9HELO|nr:hypothetical protein BP6252_10571 [Coleophoma cylindrospora]